MNLENVGETASNQGPELRMKLEDDPRMTEGTEEPSVYTALGSWTRLSLENQYVYKFEMEASQDDYVRKSVLGGFHPYAPLQPYGTEDSAHDAYYVKVPNGFLRSNFNDAFVEFSIEWPKTKQVKGDIYVSLRYLQALAENNVAWNPIHVLDLVTKKDELCKRDERIQKKEEEWLNNSEKRGKKAADAAKAAKDKMDELIQKRKNVLIPPITARVKVKAVTPGFDFSERCGKAPNPVNDVTEEQRIYGVAGDTEEKALGPCLEEMHKMSSCKWKFRGKDDKEIEEHVEECQTFRIFVKAVIPFRAESGRLCFGCYSPFPAGTKNDIRKHYDDNRSALLSIHYYDYASMQWLWKEYWKSPTAHDQPKSAKSRGWRTRYDASPLSKPLVIWILPGARTRFYNTLNNGLVEGYKRSDPAGHAHEVFGKIIAQINEREKNDASRKHTKLQLAPEKWEWESSRHYCLLSEDPFRLYQTYIHKDCIHEYMQRFKDAADEADGREAEAVSPKADGAMNLETSGTQQATPVTNKERKDFMPIRQLPIRLDHKYIDKMSEYEAKQESFTEYWPTDPKITPVKKSDDQDEDESEAEYYESDEEESNPPAQGEQIVATKTPTQEVDEEDTKPIETKSKSTKEMEKKAEKAEPKKGMTRSIHVNPINAQKVIRAAGSRKGQKDQKAVMGFSASYFADQVLGWSWRPGPKATLKDRQMSNGLYIAEWLHLSAYSWGGIQQGTNTSAQKSSQTKKNLVFGTSEANSCMTRYEKAWQQLFKDEKLLRDKLADEQAKASTTSTTSTTSKTSKKSKKSKKSMVTEIEKYGKGNDKRTYLQGELSVVCNTKSGPYLFDEIDTETEKYVWKKRNPIEEDSTLAKLAEEFPFLAYNIRYEIRLMGQSRILAPLGESDSDVAGTEYELPTILHMKAMFYPFSRRFYHRSEHLLDSALYQHMFMLGALNRFDGDRALAEKVFEGRFKTKKLNDYKSWKKLSKADEEAAGKGKALRELETLKKKPLTKETALDLQDAQVRHQQAVKAKVRNMKSYTSKAGSIVKWPMGKKAEKYIGQMSFVPKNETYVSESQGEAHPDNFKKVPGQPESSSLI
ncbi:uncharacterized protein LW93_4577 [Fusarium fujikuroi]|nr:uncharacterized protein LW93_4577 [Fusarium fujikuroi]